MNHSEEKIREDDPERYMRTLGRLAEGQEADTLKAGTLKEGRGDERKARDIEIRIE